MKRVYCLYRVSTKCQVDKDDIPMQKTSCREFAERNGWTILKEFQEKGVSGFKVSASDRDAIQDLKAAAEKKEFDVLLVFMFDRIGRIDDETPFVVEWLLLFAQNEKTFRIKYKKCVFVKMYNVAKKYPRRKSKSAWVFSFFIHFSVSICFYNKIFTCFFNLIWLIFEQF